MILCIIFNASVNIIIVLGIGGKLLGLLCIKNYRLCDHKYDRFCEKLTKLFETKKVEESSSESSSEVSKAEKNGKKNTIGSYILNTLKDPLKVQLSDSEEEKAEQKRKRAKAIK